MQNIRSRSLVIDSLIKVPVPCRLKAIWLIGFLMISVCLCGYSYATEEGDRAKKNDTGDGSAEQKLQLIYSEDVRLPENIFWPDEKLQERFKKYWELRFKRDYGSTMGMEAPHFRLMVSPPSYNSYIRSFKEGPPQITLINRTFKNPHLVSIECIYPWTLNGGRSAGFVDYWLFLRGEWYHLIKSQILFDL